MAHSFNPSTQEAEVGESEFEGSLFCKSESQDSQGYIEKPCLEKPKQEQTNSRVCYTPVISAFGNWEQESQEFKLVSAT